MKMIEFFKMYYNITNLDIPKEIYMRTIYSSRRCLKEPSSRKGGLIFGYFFICIIELVFCIAVLKKWFFILYIPIAVISILIQLWIDRFSFIYYFLSWCNYKNGTEGYKALLTKYCGPEDHYILEDKENNVRYILKRKGNRSFWRLKLKIHEKGKSNNIVIATFKKGKIYLKKAQTIKRIELTSNMDGLFIEELIKKELFIIFNSNQIVIDESNKKDLKEVTTRKFILLAKSMFSECKINGYEVLAIKSTFSFVFKLLMLLLICPLSVMFILATDDNMKALILIKILGVIGCSGSIYLLIGIIYYFTQPRILIYENEDSLIINKKYLVNIKDINSFSKKDILIPESTRTNKTVSYWGTIKIVVDDKKFVIRNVSNPLDTIDYLYKKTR